MREIWNNFYTTESKIIQDMYLQTLKGIKNIHHRSKSDSTLSIEYQLEANLAGDEDNLNITTPTFIVFGSVVYFDVFARMLL